MSGVVREDVMLEDSVEPTKPANDPVPMSFAVAK
jgi:hypothetical protein